MKVSNIANFGQSGFGSTSGRSGIKLGFQFANGGEIVLFAAEQLDDLDRRAEGGERVDLDDFEGFDTFDAAVGVLVEKSAA